MGYAEIIDAVVTQIRRTVHSIAHPTSVTVAGREHIVARSESGRLDYREVLPTPGSDFGNHVLPVVVGDIDSLIEWCRSIHNSDLGGLIVVGRGERTEARHPMWEKNHISRELATHEFYKQYLPSHSFDATLDYLGMLEWVDFLGDKLTNAANIGTSLALMKATDGRVTTVSNDGGFVSVETTESKGVVGQARFQKWLEADIPFGDPKFTQKVRFRATVMNVNGTVKFRVQYVDEGQRQAFAEWAKALLSEKVPAGWLVLVGA